MHTITARPLPTPSPQTGLAPDTGAACGDGCRRAADDPERVLSAHHTSQGTVVYYRCCCGEPRVALRHPIGGPIFELGPRHGH